MLVQDSVFLYEGQKLLGHLNIAVTQVYSHLQLERLYPKLNRIAIPENWEVGQTVSTLDIKLMRLYMLWNSPLQRKKQRKLIRGLHSFRANEKASFSFPPASSHMPVHPI